MRLRQVFWPATSLFGNVRNLIQSQFDIVMVRKCELSSIGMSELSVGARSVNLLKTQGGNSPQYAFNLGHYAAIAFSLTLKKTASTSLISPSCSIHTNACNAAILTFLIASSLVFPNTATPELVPIASICPHQRFNSGSCKTSIFK